MKNEIFRLSGENQIFGLSHPLIKPHQDFLFVVCQIFGDDRWLQKSIARDGQRTELAEGNFTR
jgi:hypothetical protein